MTLSFLGISASRSKAAPVIVLSYYSLKYKPKSFTVFRSYRKQKWRNIVLGGIGVGLWKVLLVGL